MQLLMISIEEKKASVNPESPVFLLNSLLFFLEDLKSLSGYILILGSVEEAKRSSLSLSYLILL
jgi:hypothetical protein